MERSRSRREILVSSLLKALVESSGEFEFGGSREVELKGLTGLHEVFEVTTPQQQNRLSGHGPIALSLKTQGFPLVLRLCEGGFE